MLTCKTTIVHWVEAQVPVSAWHDYYILEKSCWSLTPISLIVSQRGDLRGDHSVAQRRSCRLVADRPVSIWAWPGVRDGGQARVQGHHQFSELLQVVGRVTVREVEFPGSNPSLGDLHDNSDQSGHNTTLSTFSCCQWQHPSCQNRPKERPAACWDVCWHPGHLLLTFAVILTGSCFQHLAATDLISFLSFQSLLRISRQRQSARRHSNVLQHWKHGSGLTFALHNLSRCVITADVSLV